MIVAARCRGIGLRVIALSTFRGSRCGFLCHASESTLLSFALSTRWNRDPTLRAVSQAVDVRTSTRKACERQMQRRAMAWNVRYRTDGCD